MGWLFEVGERTASTRGTGVQALEMVKGEWSECLRAG